MPRMRRRAMVIQRAALGGCAVLMPLLLVTALVIRADAHDPPGTKVTWNGDVARIVSARCVRCHSPEGKAPMSLVTYKDARPWAKAIREEVLARRMPKWHAARGYGQFANDPSLSPFEVALFVAWIDGGAVQGPNPAKEEQVPAAELRPDSPVRPVTLQCGTRRLPTGRLLALTPHLPEGASAGFTVILPDGRREIVAWIRNFEPAFAETYWLQTAIDLPKGSRLATETIDPCEVSLHIETR